MSLNPYPSDRPEKHSRENPPSDELRQLEKATSSVHQPAISVHTDNPSTEAESVAMRESWLALSQLLDSNTSSVDEAALVSQVRHRVGRQIKRRRWKVAGMALAASLLLAVCVSWLMMRSSLEHLPDSSNPIIVQTPSIQAKPVESPTQNPTAIAWDDAYWQDDLADDLAETQQVLANVQANWSRFPDPMAWMQFQMNEFEHELGDNSL